MSTTSTAHSDCLTCEAIRSTIATYGWASAERYHSNKAGHRDETAAEHAKRLTAKLNREAELTYAMWADHEASLTEAQRRERNRKVRALRRAITSTQLIANARTREHWNAKTKGRDGTVIVEHRSPTGAIIRQKIRGVMPTEATGPVVNDTVTPAPSIEEAIAIMSTSTIHNGTYTITGPNGYRTLKVSTAQRGGLKGKRIIAALIGPDNTADYMGIAFLNHDDTASAWGRYRGTGWEALARKFVTIMTTGIEGYSFVVSNTCRRCNRKLTVPTSVHNGLGPECSGRAA